MTNRNRYSNLTIKDAIACYLKKRKTPASYMEISRAINRNPKSVSSVISKMLREDSLSIHTFDNESFYRYHLNI